MFIGSKPCEGRDRIVFALPKGSLNSDGKNETREFLLAADMPIDGYDGSARSYAPAFGRGLDSILDARIDRPRNMPFRLAAGIYDVAIMGGDTAIEAQLSGISLLGLTGLGYCVTKLVFAVSKESDAKDKESFLEQALSASSGKSPDRDSRSPKLMCASEYPLIARRFLAESKAYSGRYDELPAVCTRYGILDGNREVLVVESDGATESGVGQSAAGIRPAADCIIETVKSGKTLEENALKALGVVGYSTAGLYASPELLKDPYRYDIAGRIKERFIGVLKNRGFFGFTC